MTEAPLPPSLIITGATASVKGSAQFGSFAAGKFALRALGQSLAREFGPKGVHVAHAIIDGIIDTPNTKHYNVNNGAGDGKINPQAVRIVTRSGLTTILTMSLDCRCLLVLTLAATIGFHAGN